MADGMCSVEKVFFLDLVRDMILAYVIHEKDKVVISNVRSCRLVNKSWLRSTCRILLQSREPLFRFLLSPSKSEDEKPIQQYLKFNVEGLLIDQRFPPIAIKVSPGIQICTKGRQLLNDVLINCGNSVVELNFELVLSGSCATPLCSSVHLSRLRVFSVLLKNVGVSSIFRTEEQTFIQSVFKAGTQVQTFRLVVGNLNVLPSPNSNALANLQFPPSITELDLDCVINDSMLEVLVKNSLPNLMVLKFRVSKTKFKDGLVTNVLRNVRKTLETLHIGECYWGSKTPGPTTFQFPLMEKLENFTVENKDLELEAHVPSVQQFVPYLKQVNLRWLLPVSVPSVRKWLKMLPLHSLNSLTLPQLTGWHNDDQHHFDICTMKTIQSAYPNLRELDISFCGTKIQNVLFIMKEMTYLQRLCIKVHNVCDMHENFTSDTWDVLLTGIPKEQLAPLKESPDTWQDFELENNLSIRKLTDLHTLQLTCHYSIPQVRGPLISDVVFHFAFLKMPNLRNLILEGCFYTSSKLAKQWREEGRVIETYCWP